MDYQAPRRERLARLVAANDLDGFLVTKPVNVSYLSDFSGDSSYLLVGRDRVLFITDGRYVDQCKEECPALPLHVRPPNVKITEAAIDCLNKLGWRRVGMEAGHVTVGEAEKLKAGCPTVAWKLCDEIIEGFRAVKDEDELKQIREAIAMAEGAFNRFRQTLAGGDTEKALSDRMEMLMRGTGARCSAFPTIVGVNERAALPHAPLTERRIGGAELLLVDWGASGRFYKSDLTRILAPRKISTKLRQTYEVVLRAQSRAIAKIRPGVVAQAVDAEARAALEEAGFGSFFSHSVGHGLGMEVHEAPGLRGGNTMQLEVGMVCTVEPGVYLPEWGGIRIEDDVLITPDGCQVLTSVSKDLDALTSDF